jgi:CheY-like chemotaxis protein
MKGLILIIDDNSIDIKIATSAIEKLGYACHGFTNHNEALEWLKTNTPQLIFLDLLMPTISGYEMIPILKK